jgi:serine/threonine-protein kinase
VSSAAADALLRDRYRLLTRIAVGGMGEVWRAADYVLGREVAIKVLKPQLIDDPQFLERFRREARHTAALTHPGIAQVYDYAEEHGRAFLVMELVPGEPLSAVLQRERRLDVGRALDILAQTALALQAAHDAGVVHRDVKPGNVLVTPGGTVKITDFGISRAADGTSLTQTGRVMGTAQYLSPEQAAGHSATPLSDIYALGVVTYECLAGRRPFLGKNHVKLAEAHLREEPPPLPEDVPGPVRGLVARLLAKDPADRPQNAALVSQQFVSLRRSLGRRAGAGGAAGPPAVPAPRPAQPFDPDLAQPFGLEARPGPDTESGREAGTPPETGASRTARHRAASHRVTSSHRVAASHRVKRRGSRIRGIIVAVAGLLVLALVAGGLWLANRGKTSDRSSAHPAPVLTGSPAGCHAQTAAGPGTVSSIAPCTAQEGRGATTTVVSVPAPDHRGGQGKGKGTK